MCLFLDYIDVAPDIKVQLLSLLEADIPDVMEKAAAAGDSFTLSAFLSKHPHQVSSGTTFNVVMLLNDVEVYGKDIFVGLCNREKQVDANISFTNY